jgi:hypothetical protein
MDEHTLEVVARWHRTSAKRWWGMIPASIVASVHNEASNRMADHLSLIRSRKEKQRKCEDCWWWADGRCDLGAVRWVPRFPCTDTTCRICFEACGVNGKLWEPKK